MPTSPQSEAPKTPPIALFAVPLDENAFVDWLIDAKPGDRIAYYRGHLGHDRMASVKVLDRRSRSVLNEVANRVMVASAQGLLLPVQKRVGSEDCIYFAVKAHRRRVGSAARSVALTSSTTAGPLTAALAA